MVINYDSLTGEILHLYPECYEDNGVSIEIVEEGKKRKIKHRTLILASQDTQGLEDPTHPARPQHFKVRGKAIIKDNPS